METPPRPKKQDIRPKDFHVSPVEMVTKFEPTDRYILWIISNYPYIFNMHFMGDALKMNWSLGDENSPLDKALTVLRSLRMRRLIKQSKDRLKWSITLKGQIFRITSHPSYDVLKTSVQITVAILTAATIFILNKRANKEKEVKGKEEQTIPLNQKIKDSSLNEHQYVLDSLNNKANDSLKVH